MNYPSSNAEFLNAPVVSGGQSKDRELLSLNYFYLCVTLVTNSNPRFWAALKNGMICVPLKRIKEK